MEDDDGASLERNPYRTFRPVERPPSEAVLAEAAKSCLELSCDYQTRAPDPAHADEWLRDRGVATGTSTAAVFEGVLGLCGLPFRSDPHRVSRRFGGIAFHAEGLRFSDAELEPVLEQGLLWGMLAQLSSAPSGTVRRLDHYVRRLGPLDLPAGCEGPALGRALVEAAAGRLDAAMRDGLGPKKTQCLAAFQAEPPGAIAAAWLRNDDFRELGRLCLRLKLLEEAIEAEWLPPDYRRHRDAIRRVTDCCYDALETWIHAHLALSVLALATTSPLIGAPNLGPRDFDATLAATKPANPAPLVQGCAFVAGIWRAIGKHRYGRKISSGEDAGLSDLGL